MRLVVAVLVGLFVAAIVLWLVVLVAYLVLRPQQGTLSDAVRLVPDAIRLIHRLARDKRVDRWSRLRLLMLLVYLASPIDLVPDVIPVLGYADDLLLIAVVVRGVIRRAGPEIVRGHWPGTPEGLARVAKLCRAPELITEWPDAAGRW